MICCWQMQGTNNIIISLTFKYLLILKLICAEFWRCWHKKPRLDSFACSCVLFCCFRCLRCCRRPGRGNGKIPSMSDISSQLAYVSNARQLPDRLRNDISLYLKPGVAEFGTLEFGSFGAIREIGLNHAQKSITAWKKYLEEEGDPIHDHVFLMK